MEKSTSMHEVTKDYLKKFATKINEVNVETASDHLIGGMRGIEVMVDVDGKILSLNINDKLFKENGIKYLTKQIIESINDCARKNNERIFKKIIEGISLRELQQVINNERNEIRDQMNRYIGDMKNYYSQLASLYITSISVDGCVEIKLSYTKEVQSISITDIQYKSENKQELANKIVMLYNECNQRINSENEKKIDLINKEFGK
jgi:DNA-binding protein YbaB